MPFHIGGGHGIWEFVNGIDGPAFLERELMGLGVHYIFYNGVGTQGWMISNRQGW